MPEFIERQECPICHGQIGQTHERGCSRVVGAWPGPPALPRVWMSEAVTVRYVRERQAESRPGTWAAIAAGLDEYHAVNLREALKLVPDTGDWHGSLRAAIEIVLKDRPSARPNQTAEQMRDRQSVPVTEEMVERFCWRYHALSGRGIAPAYVSRALTAALNGGKDE